jgi:hypothetical protein
MSDVITFVVIIVIVINTLRYFNRANKYDKKHGKKEHGMSWPGFAFRVMLYSFITFWCTLKFKQEMYGDSTLQTIHECVLEAEVQKCEYTADLQDKLFEQLPTEWSGQVILNKEEQVKIITSYAKKDAAIAPESDCYIGAGYNNCKDVGFQAVDLFFELRKEVKEL